MNFGKAIELVESGKKIARIGWNGKQMFVFYIPKRTLHASELPEHLQGAIVGELRNIGDGVVMNAYLVLKGADGALNTWVPSISDTLADDWGEV